MYVQFMPMHCENVWDRNYGCWSGANINHSEAWNQTWPGSARFFTCAAAAEHQHFLPVALNQSDVLFCQSKYDWVNWKAAVKTFGRRWNGGGGLRQLAEDKMIH